MKKVLFYIEPHPIRNSMVMYRNIIYFFRNVVNANCYYELRFYSNLETLEEGKRWIDKFDKYCIYPDYTDELFYRRELLDWDNEGISDWIKLMEVGNKIFIRHKKIIEKIYKKYRFDYIVSWGTNEAVKAFYKENDVGFINMELGCSRKPFIDTVCFDPCGVNGDASISKLSIGEIKKEVRSNNTRSYNIVNYGYKHSSIAYEQDFKYVNYQELRELIASDKKIAFIPLQLYDDANLKKYSNYNSVIQMIKEIIPKLLNKGYYCVIKEHPGSSSRNGAIRENNIAREYVDNNDAIKWIDRSYKEIPNSFFYLNSDLVVTINSSAGFEALYYDKDVVVLGDAVYKVQDVFYSLDIYLDRGYDNEYKKNIKVLREFFLDYYLVDTDIFMKPDALMKRIEGVGDLSRKKYSSQELVRWFIENSIN